MFVELFEDSYLDLCQLESLIKLMLDSSYNLDSKSEFYENNVLSTLLLCQERNNITNILNISLEKINKLKKFYNHLENSEFYSKTPTIAADK